MDYEGARRRRGQLQRAIERAYREGQDPSALEAELDGMGTDGTGPRPRAEPDQVVRQVEKGKDGKFVGRKAGAVATFLVDKEVGINNDIKPSLQGSQWQMDIIDMHTLGGAKGYAIVAVDTATRKMYGRTMNTKTADDIVDTVRDMLDDVVVPGADPPSMSPEVPTQLDMDYERGWTNNPEFDALLQEFGIQQRFKTDKYAPQQSGGRRQQNQLAEELFAPEVDRGRGGWGQLGGLL